MGSRDTSARPHVGGDPAGETRLLPCCRLHVRAETAVSQGTWGPVSFLSPPGTATWTAVSRGDAERTSRETSPNWQSLPISPSHGTAVLREGRLPLAGAASAQR